MKIKLPKIRSQGELASEDPVDIAVDDFAIDCAPPLFLRDTPRRASDERFFVAYLRFIALTGKLLHSYWAKLQSGLSLCLRHDLLQLAVNNAFSPTALGATPADASDKKRVGYAFASLIKGCNPVGLSD